MAFTRSASGPAADDRLDVPAVRSAIGILQFLGSNPDSRGRDVASALSMNASTSHGILKTLVSGGFLEFDDQTKRYRLGPALVALGAKAWQVADYVDLVRPWLGGWVARYGFTAFIARLLPHGEIVVVDKVEGTNEIKTTVDYGERFPLSAAALGKAFLAWMDPTELDELLNRMPLPRFTPSSITDAVSYRGELERVRKQGWSASNREYYTESNAVAAPVFDPQGRVAFVVCSLASVGEMTDIRIPEYGTAVRELADSIRHAIVHGQRGQEQSPPALKKPRESFRGTTAPLRPSQTK